MSLMSDILTNVVKAIGVDIKAIYAKFDATGKLLKDNLPTLTKSDVGLGNVNNTADASKSVASAAKLTTARRLDFSGSLRAYSDLYFDGSKDINIGVELRPTAAFSDLYKGEYSYVANNSSPVDTTLFAGGTRYSCTYGKPAEPWYNWATWGSYYIDTVGYSGNEFLQTVLPSRKHYDPFKGMFVRRFSRGGIENSAANYKWVPISTNVYTYETTTTETPNVYVGSDGVLKRSTNPPKSTVILEGTIGTADNGYQTSISHGLNVSRIKSVTAKVNISTDASIPMYIQENSLSGIEAGIIGYINYFTVGFNSYFVTLTAHRNATNIHGKPVTVFVETY